jgi:cytochrome bd-type quinol oxidase subunit 1
MDSLALLLSRLQFAFTISFHIIYPFFTIRAWRSCSATQTQEWLTA